VKILKFGGTSMKDAEAWHRVLTIIRETGSGTVTVVSATSGTTSSLILAAETACNGDLSAAFEISDEVRERHTALIKDFFNIEAVRYNDNLINNGFDHILGLTSKLNNYLLGIHTLGELSPKSLDAVSATGEQLSSYLLSLCGQATGMDTTWVDAAQILRTDSTFGKAVPDMAAVNKQAAAMINLSEEGRFPIMGGFYGSDSSGTITTLGRGGSDYTASIIGLAMDAEAIEIWTDVSGMYSSDPRVIRHAFSIRELSFNEAAELAYFGAKVLHPATIQPAVEKNIPVYIKNSFEPAHPGTRIYSDVTSDSPVRAIAFKKDITVITVISSRMLLAWGFLARVFRIFEKHEVSVDLVTTSEVSISMTVDKKTKLDAVLKDIGEIGAVKVYEDQALISMVGKNLLAGKGIAARAFEALSSYPVRMISQGSSDTNLSVVVENSHANEAVQALHDAFFPPEKNGEQ
jgi:aspartate kinase